MTGNFNIALRAIRGGRFTEALGHLQGLHLSAGEPSYDNHQALLADVLQQTGDNTAAEGFAKNLIKRKTFDLSALSRSHIVLGTIARERRNVAAFVDHFKKAINFANDGSDVELACWAKLRLMLAVAEQQGTDAAITMLPDVRAHVTRLGDSAATATLHLCLAKLEGTRGCLSNARRHIRISRSLLAEHPNVWVQGNADLDDACISFLASDVDSALSFATSALRATNDSGHAATRRAACANLGHVHLARGEFPAAELHFREALRLCQPGGGSEIAILDGLAQLALAQGQFETCETFLNAIEDIETTSSTKVTYYKSWAFRTRLHLLTRLGRHSDAIDLIQTLKNCWMDFPPALRTGLEVLDAELKSAVGDTDDANRAISTAYTTCDGLSIEILGDIERVLADILRRSNQADAAGSHTERAARLFDAAGNIRSRDRIISEHLTFGTLSTNTARHPGRTLEHIKALFELSEYPDLFGWELVALLREMNCTQQLHFITRRGPLGQEISNLASYSDKSGGMTTGEECVTIDIGLKRADTYMVSFVPSRDLGSQLACASINRMAHSIMELRRLRTDLNERRAIWPSDEPVVRAEGVFAAPSMVEIVKTIRKIGVSSIPVLLTGETGTGKEVVAKIVHNTSSRAPRPFIPFNCSAVPKDLVESQLFGYRRGAFSGANDQFDGVIRAASGGTLFLDEIGEMSLDVQPKLLRFLESGEIHPLGETKPIHVDVRIVAASNANLERLVSQGRFREDLFYRLDVVRLAIPALRERREEIPLLATHLLERHSREHHKAGLTISDDSMEYLLLYEWPGNIRQLSNELEKFVALAEDGATLLPEHLSSDIGMIRKAASPTANRLAVDNEIIVRLDQPLSTAVKSIERAMLLHALSGSKGRVDIAAKTLGLSRKGLYLKRKRLHLASDN